jgi:hypothetical protein
MGRHVAEDIPELDRYVDGTCAAIGREIEALGIPRLAGVVLGGGYGRGEGGAKAKLESEVGERNDSALETPTLTLSNDMDFFAITDEGADEGSDVPRIAASLEPISRKWTGKTGIDIDFMVRTPWRIRHDERRIMIQELLRGYFDVEGRKGEELFAEVRRHPAEDLPWGEAARLLLNRGMGLLLAKSRAEGPSDAESPKPDDFIARNINKCVLGAGDALLVARHGYRWRALDRAEAIGDELYRKALGWKFRPLENAVCDWETARGIWLGAYDEVMAAGAGNSEACGRTLFNAARWLVRRRSLGPVATLGLTPEVRVLKGVAGAIRARGSVSQALRRDWEVFN